MAAKREGVREPMGSGPVQPKTIARSLPKGALHWVRAKVIHLVTAGGGGYGDPEERDLELVREDLRNNLISEIAAKEIYGLDRRSGN